MNDLQPLLPASMSHVDIPDNARRHGKGNHSITNSIVHFSTTSPLRQGAKSRSCNTGGQKNGIGYEYAD
jgi:hypothetical protein